MVFICSCWGYCCIVGWVWLVVGGCWFVCGLFRLRLGCFCCGGWILCWFFFVWCVVYGWCRYVLVVGELVWCCDRFGIICCYWVGWVVGCWYWGRRFWFVGWWLGFLFWWFLGCWRWSGLVLGWVVYGVWVWYWIDDRWVVIWWWFFGDWCLVELVDVCVR